MFTRDTLQGRFEKVKDYMKHETETIKGKWARAVNKYRQEIGLTWSDLKEIDKKSLKTRIREWDTQRWRYNM